MFLISSPCLFLVISYGFPHVSPWIFLDSESATGPRSVSGRAASHSNACSCKVMPKAPPDVYPCWYTSSHPTCIYPY